MSSTLITGGAGFIGANFVHDWIPGSDEPVVNLDKLPYAGIRKTVRWYLDKPQWVQSSAYSDWASKQYEGSAA